MSGDVSSTFVVPDAGDTLIVSGIPTDVSSQDILVDSYVVFDLGDTWIATGAVLSSADLALVTTYIIGQPLASSGSQFSTGAFGSFEFGA